MAKDTHREGSVAHEFAALFHAAFFVAHDGVRSSGAQETAVRHMIDTATFHVESFMRDDWQRQLEIPYQAARLAEQSLTQAKTRAFSATTEEYIEALHTRAIGILSDWTKNPKLADATSYSAGLPLAVRNSVYAVLVRPTNLAIETLILTCLWLESPLCATSHVNRTAEEIHKRKQKKAASVSAWATIREWNLQYPDRANLDLEDFVTRELGASDTRSGPRTDFELEKFMSLRIPHPEGPPPHLTIWEIAQGKGKATLGAPAVPTAVSSPAAPSPQG